MDRAVAAITGASAGLGVEFARQLAGKGYDLILIARRPDRLQQVADQIQAIHNVHCEILPADLTKDEDLHRVEDRIASNTTLLVNNAGFGTLGRFWEADLTGQDAMHRLHVMATMRLSHAALPGMVARNKGGIINVSSVAGFALTAGSTSYCATKAWMNRFTEGLYVELKSAGSQVKVQALCPGFTRTEFHSANQVDVSKVPNWMWLSAERVVRDSLQAFDRGRLFVIPSRRYRSMLRAYGLLPPSARYRIAIGSGREQGRMESG